MLAYIVDDPDLKADKGLNLTIRNDIKMPFMSQYIMWIGLMKSVYEEILKCDYENSKLIITSCMFEVILVTLSHSTHIKKHEVKKKKCKKIIIIKKNRVSRNQ